MLRFRKITRDDLEMIRQWRMLPEVTKYMYTDPMLTLDDQTKWFEKIKGDQSRRDWIIQYDGEDVGLANITNIDNFNKNCDWAYYLASVNIRGKGIGKAVELNMHHYVFEELGLHKLCCTVFSWNELVINIHKKYGSRIEGIRKEHIFKNGKFHDIVEMAILKSDWGQEVKGKYEYQIGTFE